MPVELLFGLLCILFVICFAAFCTTVDNNGEYDRGFWAGITIGTLVLFLGGSSWLYSNLIGPSFGYNDKMQYECELVPEGNKILIKDLKQGKLVNALTYFGQIPSESEKVVARFRAGGWYLGLYSTPQKSDQPNYFLVPKDGPKEVGKEEK